MKLSPATKNISAIVYVFVVYALGVILLTTPFWLLNAMGMILLVHSLILSATFIHEFIHGNIFKERKLNQFWGQAMTHLNGACYATWDDLVVHHFNHHIHHADFVAFDIPTYVQNLPKGIRQVFLALEWAYLPMFELMLRLKLILSPFQDPKKSSLKVRTLTLLFYRSFLVLLLARFSLKALVLYAISYICFVNFVRFADAFHHTYEYVIVGEPFLDRDRVYEQENTFSNLVSSQYLWLNLLFLNFGYHNAHHHDMRCPWYDLPQLHEKLYGKGAKNLLPLPQLVSNYHRFRIDRLFGGQGAVAAPADTPQLASFTGGVGVSFLTPP